MTTISLPPTVPVGAAAVERAAELPARIFGTHERWGWEYLPPGPVAVPPDRPQPLCHLPPPTWAAEADRRRARSARRRVLLFLAGAGLALAYVIAGFVEFYRATGASAYSDLAEPERTRLEQEAVARYLEAHPLPGDLPHYLGLGPDLVLAALAACAVLWVAAGLYARMTAAAAHRRWLAAVRRALDEYTEGIAPWTAGRRSARAEEAARMGGLPYWFPLGPGDEGRVDVFGGTQRGWCCLLLTAGASLVGSGARLAVLDLSREAVAEPLARLGAAHGRSVRHLRLAGAAPDVNLLGGLDPREAAEALVTAAHAAAESVPPETYTLDVRVLGRVGEILAPELTVSRICAGLRTLLHQEPYPGPDSPLTVDEYERLTEAFGESSRKAFEARITAIEAHLHPLIRFGGGSGRPLLDGGAEMSIVELDEAAGELTAGTLAPLLLNVVAAHAQREGGGAALGALVVAGADLIPLPQLERLDRIARRHGVRLVYLFRHVRDSAEQLMGSGGPVVLMRVGNAKGAEAATTFIGREHRFVLNQLTIGAGTGTNESNSTTHTLGTSQSSTTSDSRSFTGIQGTRTFGTSVTTGTSESTATGISAGTSTNFNESAGRQRSYDLTVEPRQLQTLPETALFVVDPGRREGPRARLGDCNPWLVAAPGVVDEPHRALAG